MNRKEAIPEEIFDVLLYYQEMMIKHSDINYKHISNEHATKFVLGRIMRLPRHLQVRALNGMEKLNLMKRVNQQLLEINKVC